MFLDKISQKYGIQPENSKASYHTRRKISGRLHGYLYSRTLQSNLDFTLMYEKQRL